MSNLEETENFDVIFSTLELSLQLLGKANDRPSWGQCKPYTTRVVGRVETLRPRLFGGAGVRV